MNKNGNGVKSLDNSLRDFPPSRPPEIFVGEDLYNELQLSGRITPQKLFSVVRPYLSEDGDVLDKKYVLHRDTAMPTAGYRYEYPAD